MRIKEIKTFLYPVTSRAGYVFLQFLVVFLYSRYLSTDGLATYNLLNTFILLFLTLMLHPYDVELQKRYVKRFHRKTSLHNLVDIHKTLMFLSIIFACVATFTFLISSKFGFHQFAFFVIALSLSQYVSHSIRSTFLNIGKTAYFNKLTLAEIFIKFILISIFVLNGSLTLFWLLLCLWSPNVVIFFNFLLFTSIKSSKRSFKRSVKKIIILIDNRFFFRAFSNIWHWSITNLFKILFAVNGQSENLAMGITAFVIGNSIMQSINLVIAQLTFPKIYDTNGIKIKPYIYSAIISAFFVTTLLVIFGNIMLKIVFGDRFYGYNIFLIAGLWTEMLNGIIGVIGVRLNFLKLDKKFMGFYIIGATASIMILFVAYLIDNPYVVISAPVIGLMIPILLNIKRELRLKPNS